MCSSVNTCEIELMCWSWKTINSIIGQPFLLAVVRSNSDL